MTQTAYTAKEGKITLNIVYDHIPENPRNFDNLGTMACWHRRYALGDIQPKCTPEEYLEELAEEVSGNNQTELTPEKVDQIIEGHYYMLPLYLYDHGGISISTGRYICPWDSGQVGFIYVSKKDIEEKTLLDEQQAYNALKQEVKMYDLYLQGNVYGYQLLESVKCPTCGHDELKQIDACYGFYGEDWKNNGLEENMPEEYRHLLEKLD